MFPTEQNVLRAIKNNSRWPEMIKTDYDIPGLYISLLIKSCIRRGLVKRQWIGGYRLTRNGINRLVTLTAGVR